MRIGISLISVLALMLLGYAVVLPHLAVGNALQFAPEVKTGTVYMTPGTATTTLNYDSFESTSRTKTDEASLLVRLTASSTASELKWRYEFSNDNSTWYSENIDLNTNATTTQTVRDFHEYSWLFTPSLAASSDSTNGYKLFDIPTPLRYTRVVFYLPIGSDNAAVSASIIGAVQIR